jgi:DivIVA domain-containing protein
MDDKTISLNAKLILTKVFTPDVKGYDADQVDEFLDNIAKDYQAFEAYYKDSQKYIVDLETQLRKSRDQVSGLEVDNARLSKRLEGIKDSDSVTTNNIDLLQRIGRLEKELFRLGVDPRKI